GPNAILDLSANPLLANSTDPATLGQTFFTISLQQMDFGSAPAPYPTTLAQNGARHIISNGLFLGSGVTASPDGVPSATADNGLAGDGVVFNTPLVPGTTATITVTVSKASFLDGWVDFNGNGSWADSGDQVFASKALVAGANVLTFTVPSTNA